MVVEDACWSDFESQFEIRSCVFSGWCTFEPVAAQKTVRTARTRQAVGSNATPRRLVNNALAGCGGITFRITTGEHATYRPTGRLIAPDELQILIPGFELNTFLGRNDDVKDVRAPIVISCGADRQRDEASRHDMEHKD